MLLEAKFMEEKALRSDGYPFGHFLPVGAGRVQQAAVDFIADDQPITEQDLAERLEAAYNELEAA